jgi:hypothetical protein
VISENTAAEKERLIVDYNDRLISYESQFCTYRTWLDNDARASSVLIASTEDSFTTDIVDFERTHQMWSFLRQKHESTGQSTYLLLFIKSRFFARVTLQLRTSLINFLLFDVSLTLSCLLPLVSPAEIRQLHLSFVGPTTF